jgi:ABC-type nitrate/sulfonate/bicarbonate transport system permease component
LIRNSCELLQVDDRFVGIVVIGILELTTSISFAEIERLVIPWRAD